MWILLLACSVAESAAVEPPAPLAGHPELVEAARRYLGRPYRFGGRGEQLDCMGLVFLAWSSADRGPWRKLSVNPTTLVAKGQLGQPAPGLDGVLAGDIDLALLAPGDVLLLLGWTENPSEPALTTLGGLPAWTWHMGLYSGGGRFIVGDHYAGKVVEEPLLAHLGRHLEYAGLYAVRPP
ncbi:MAG: C40 family peptidase [Deltaproteobacteria bacterium]|nr:C40 family peptidase [Deltaproteobacteria bacterium]